MDTSFCEPCNARYKQTTVVKWCMECEEKLCSECTENHQVQKMSRHHHLVDIDKMPQKLDITSFCQKHECLQFEYFCIDHDILCCKECLAESHRTCEKVMSIDVASVNFKGSQAYIDTIQHIRHIIESLKALGDNRKENIATLATDSSKIPMAIGNVKQRIIKHLDVLEELLLSKLDQIKDKYISNINEDVDTISDIITETREHKSSFDFINDNGTDKQAFLLVHSSNQILRNIEDKVNSLTKKVMEVNITFNDNQLEKSMTTLGSIDTKETPYMVPCVPPKQRQSQIHVDTDPHFTSFTFNRDINLKQKYAVIITGMAVTDNNVLLLCDVSLQQIHICDDNDIYRNSIDLQYAPWDIATIPSTAIAVVSSRLDPYIQFIDITRRTKLRTTNIPGIEWGGISTTIENILVGGKSKIFVLDHNGNTLRAIFSSLNNPNSIIWYISVGSNDLLNFTNADGLHSISLHGYNVFSYELPNLLSARKVALDKCGNIYVVGCDSNNIYKRTPDGKVVELVLSTKDGLNGPYAICYNKDYTKLYLSNKYGSTVSVFKVN